MRKLLYFPILFLFIMLVQSTTVEANDLNYQDDASEVILNSLKGQPKYSFLKRLYTRLLFMPIWMRDQSLSPAAKDLFRYIKNEGTLSLDGKLLQDIIMLEQMAKDLYASKEATLAQKIDLEFKISQLYKGYTDYAYFGSINWGAFQARISNLMVNDVSTEWVLHRPLVDPIGIIESAALGESSIKKLFEKAIPTTYHYKALQKALRKYIALQEAGGWFPVLLKRKLTPGMSDEGVPSLRERLYITNDYADCNESSKENKYDKCLQKAVKRFQVRNGLSPDAVVGPGTLRVLNKSIESRITTIRLNLDRIKWLNKRSPKNHIVINIPDFKLYFEIDGKLRKKMRVIVGKSNHPTPIFSDIVENIVLNPYWNIPRSIIQKEMVPKLIKNPHYLDKKNIEIRRGWGRNSKIVHPDSVDWYNYQDGMPMPFHFAQLPGKKNALGKIKFLFPNRFSVYMHDTPAKSLFSRSKRAFSHGCIRLHKPKELLKSFSEFNSNIDIKKSKKILEGKTKTNISLRHKTAIDVVYLTAWVDYDGNLQFRKDVYDYDKMQLKSFRRW